MECEQRKNPRFRMKEDELILFHDGLVGRVGNLSMEGCSCKCMVTDNVFSKPTKLSIIHPSNGVKLVVKNVSFSIVHSCLNNILPFTSTRTKNCGIKFRDISSSQKKQIELLISQYAEN